MYRNTNYTENAAFKQMFFIIDEMVRDFEDIIVGTVSKLGDMLQCLLANLD